MVNIPSKTPQIEKTQAVGGIMQATANPQAAGAFLLDLATFTACLPNAVRVDLGKRAMARLLRTAAAAFLILRRAAAFCFVLAIIIPLMALEELNSSLVCPRFCQARKRAQITPLSGFRILLARVQPVLS